jgi:hypothetical protein
MKCTYRKINTVDNSSPSKNSPDKRSPQKTKNDDDSDSSDIFAEDSERDEDKKEEISSRFDYVACNPFKDLYKCTALYNFMTQFGSNIVPLSVVGIFLNYTGNHLLHYIKQVMRKKVFYPSHTV